MIKKYFFIFYMFFVANVANAQKNEDNSFFTVTIENDFFGSGKDEHYTNGVRFTYHDAYINPPKLINSLAELIPFFHINDTTSSYYSFGQNLYTPEVISVTKPDSKDRPYAGFLYGSVGYNTATEDHIDDVEVTFGVVGPTALGEQTQKFVHDFLDMQDPKGWGEQLENEPAFILAYQRNWPELYKIDFEPLLLRITPHAGATIGNIYTYGNVGVTLQLMPSRYNWYPVPSRVRPSIPGSGFFAVPSDELSWSIFAGVEGRAVAHNIFLDGNTFEDSQSVDKKHGVLDANIGATFTYGRVQFSYTLSWRSDEFDGQKDNSLFGVLSAGYRF